MRDILPYAAAYFILISLFSVIITVADKVKAVKNRRRISEKALITAGIFGGALFEYITMKIIRHKTMHKKFMIGLPVIIVLQAAIIICIIIIAMRYRIPLKA